MPKPALERCESPVANFAPSDEKTQREKPVGRPAFHKLWESIRVPRTYKTPYGSCSRSTEQGSEERQEGLCPLPPSHSQPTLPAASPSSLQPAFPSHFGRQRNSRLTTTPRSRHRRTRTYPQSRAVRNRPFPQRAAGRNGSARCSPVTTLAIASSSSITSIPSFLGAQQQAWGRLGAIASSSSLENSPDSLYASCQATGLARSTQEHPGKCRSLPIIACLLSTIAIALCCHRCNAGCRVPGYATAAEAPGLSGETARCNVPRTRCATSSMPSVPSPRCTRAPSSPFPCPENINTSVVQLLTYQLSSACITSDDPPARGWRDLST